MLLLYNRNALGGLECGVFVGFNLLDRTTVHLFSCLVIYLIYYFC